MTRTAPAFAPYAPPMTMAHPLRPFTPAQERIAELLADGHSQDGAARVLGCSFHTVRAHIRTMGFLLHGEGTATERVRAFARARRAKLRGDVREDAA